MQGLARCITMGAPRPDAAIAHQILLAVRPVAVEAAFMAEQDANQHLDERRRALALECQQAEYEVTLAARRYEAVDPDNRLVAAELEARWNAALTRLQECQARLAAGTQTPAPRVTREAPLTLSADLEAAWQAPTTDMRTKQRLVRTLIEEIVVDVDDAMREVVLIVHWRGGQHSDVRAQARAGRAHEADLHRRRAADSRDGHPLARRGDCGHAEPARTDHRSKQLLDSPPCRKLSAQSRHCRVRVGGEGWPVPHDAGSGPEARRQRVT
jgi:hypothetical protein